MNKIVAILTISTVFHLSSTTIFKSEGNAYYKINRKLQSSLNNIFLLLQLNKAFTVQEKNRLLLSMHANLKNIAENNYELYKGIRKICKSDIPTRLKGTLFRLDKLIEVFIEDELIPINNTKDEVKVHGLRLSSIEIPENPEDATSFLKDYLNNVEDMQIVGYETPSDKIRDNYQKSSQIRLVKSRNLRKWKPPNVTADMDQVPNTRRIYHGKFVNIKKFPFIVSIHVMEDFVCAGSIISKDMIITAATCLQTTYNSDVFLRDTPEGVSVRVGSDYTQHHGEVRTISKVFFHPDYEPLNLQNNLAILKMTKQLHFEKSNKKIRRIEFEGLDSDKLKNNKVILLGWGDDDADKVNVNEKLSYTKLDLLDLSKCTDVYSMTYVNETNFCAGISSVGSGACRRDVGGPAVSGSMLVGVVSFGPPICGTPDVPTVFTDLGYHLDWINSVVKNTPKSAAEATAVKTGLQDTIAKGSTVMSPVDTKYTSKSAMLLKQLLDPKVREKILRNAANGNFKHVLPRSVYPKAIQVVTYLVNELLAGGANIDDIAYEDNDQESEGNEEIDIGGLLPDQAEDEAEITTAIPMVLTRLYQAETSTNREGLRNDVAVTTAVTANFVETVDEQAVSPEAEAEIELDENNAFLQAIKSLTEYISSNIYAPIKEGVSEMAAKAATDNTSVATQTETPIPTLFQKVTNPEMRYILVTTKKETDAPELQFGGLDLQSLPRAQGMRANVYNSTQQERFNIIDGKSRYNRQRPENDEEESEESDNYESESDRGLSIEVPRGMPIVRQGMTRATVNVKTIPAAKSNILNISFVKANNLPPRSQKLIINKKLITALLRQKLTGQKLTGQKLTGQKLTGQKLTGQKLSKVNKKIPANGFRKELFLGEKVTDNKVYKTMDGKTMKSVHFIDAYEFGETGNVNGRRSISDYINFK